MSYTKRSVQPKNEFIGSVADNTHTHIFKKQKEEHCLIAGDNAHHLDLLLSILKYVYCSVTLSPLECHFHSNNAIRTYYYRLINGIVVNVFFPLSKKSRYWGEDWQWKTLNNKWMNHGGREKIGAKREKLNN